MNSVLFKGVDGDDSLCFLTIMGVFRVISQRKDVTMRWVCDQGTWHPVIEGVDRDCVLEILNAHFTNLVNNRVLYLPTKKLKGKEVLLIHSNPKKKKKSDDDDEVVDEPSEDHFVNKYRLLCKEALECGDYVALSFLTAFGDVNGKTFYRSNLCLNSSNGHCLISTESKLLEQFAKQAGLGFLQETKKKAKKKTGGISFESLIDGPWQLADEGNSRGWSPQECRYHGKDYYPTDTKHPAVTNWTANLLAFEALPLFPSYFNKRKIRTVGFTILPKKSYFTWPIWQSSLSIKAAQSLIALPRLHEEEFDNDLRKFLGKIRTVVFRCETTAINEKGGKAFLPARLYSAE